MTDFFLAPLDMVGIHGLFHFTVVLTALAAPLVLYSLYKIWKTKRCPVSSVVCVVGAVVACTMYPIELDIAAAIPPALGVCCAMCFLEIWRDRDKEHIVTAVATLFVAGITWLVLVFLIAAPAV